MEVFIEDYLKIVPKYAVIARQNQKIK